MANNFVLNEKEFIKSELRYLREKLYDVYR